MKEKKIKVSVLIAMYNAEKYIERCIISILNQSLREIEVIIVNDGSSDNSLKKLEKFIKKDNRIVLINQSNKGVVKTRNTALSLARGEYCINIDSDDWIEEDYLKDLYYKATKNDLDIVISDIKIDSEKSSYILKDLMLFDNELINGSEYFNLLLTENFYGYLCNKLIKTKLYRENSLKYNENILFLCEDINMLLKLCKYSNRIGKINKAYYHYTIHGENGTKNLKLTHLYDIYECFREVEEVYNENISKVKMLKRVKLGNITALLVGGKFNHLYGYKEFTTLILKELKRTEFLLKKYKRESYFKIIGINMLKLFPHIYTIKILQIIFNFKIKIKFRKII